MCGISGSGKTYYSKRLEAEGYLRLSLDEIIWESYGADFPSLPFPRQQEIFAEGFERLERELLGAIEEGRKVVVDSTMCKRGKRDHMRRLCKGKGVKPEFMYLESPLATLKERMLRRRGQGPNDQIVPPSRLETFYNNFDRPEPDETDVVKI